MKQKFEKLGIELETLLIKINNEQEILECRYRNSNQAIDAYLETFEDSDLYPKAVDLDLILKFYEHFVDNRIADKEVYHFILTLKKPMIQKQYLLHWIRHTYGLNCNQVCISSILPPNRNECMDIIETRLISLLCLFYDVTPTQLAHIQLCSIVSVKPNYCFKST